MPHCMPWRAHWAGKQVRSLRQDAMVGAGPSSDQKKQMIPPMSLPRHP